MNGSLIHPRSTQLSNFFLLNPLAVESCSERHGMGHLFFFVFLFFCGRKRSVFHFKGAAFSSQLKSKVGNILAKAVALHPFRPYATRSHMITGPLVIETTTPSLWLNPPRD
jgi:hypothetical protein